MYATEKGNKVILHCKAPKLSNLMQFWTEVQEYMDKGYRYNKEVRATLMECPTAMAAIRIMLVKDEDVNTDSTIDKSDEVEETPVVSPVKKTNKKATAKKPAAKK